MRFQRSIMVSPTTLFVPDLYERLTDPDYVPPDQDAQEGVHFPVTDDDFEAMVEEWEAIEAEKQRRDTYGPHPG